VAGVEDRVARLERDYARLDQRDVNASQQLQSLTPLPTQMVRLESGLEALRDGLKAVKEDIDELRDGISDRTKEQSEERRSLKLALIGLTGVIGAALIGGVFLLLAGSGVS
jgi:chromosome segregation ATPase